MKARKGIFAPLALLLSAFVFGSAPARGEDVFEVKSKFAATDKSVVLTLDACAGRFDWELARYLVYRNIPATIFVSGSFASSNKAAMEYMMSRPDLFSIQNHGSKHLVPIAAPGSFGGIPNVGTPEGLRQEVEENKRLLQTKFGIKAELYRGASAVYGEMALKDITGAYGSVPLGYSLSADGGGSIRGDRLLKRVSAAKPGDIILGHINRPDLLLGRYIGYGIEELIKEGFRVVPLSEVSSKVKQELVRAGRR